MKAAILGDTHFGARNDHPAFARFFERFYSDCFFPTLRARGIKRVFQMGDGLDRRKYINFVTLKEARRYYYERSYAEGIETDSLVGNHDTYYKNTNRVNSPALLFNEFKDKMRWYSRPTEIQLNGSLVLMLPWICDDNLKESLEMIENTKATICFGHLELYGFEMYRGQKIELAHAMKPEMFDKFDVVLSGHFHHRSSQGNITYVGTPYEITWSDYDDPKGFHIFDTDTRELEFIPNPFTMFSKLWYDDKDRHIKDVNAIDFEQYRDKFTKVVVINKTNPYGFDLYIDALEKAGVLDVQVVDDHKHADQQPDSDILLEAGDTLSIITSSVQAVGDVVDRDELKMLMTDLYTEALTIE